MKTLSIYNLKKEEYKEVMEELSEDLLLDFMFTPLTTHNQYRIGFVSNLDGTLISHQRDGILMTIRDQKKTPEPNEIAVHLQLKIDAHKREHEVEPNSRQKAVMKAEVITSL
jgi:DNA recombination-dependent growth factor C